MDAEWASNVASFLRRLGELERDTGIKLDAEWGGLSGEGIDGMGLILDRQSDGRWGVRVERG